MTVTLEAHSDGDTDSAIVNHIDNNSVRKTSVKNNTSYGRVPTGSSGEL